MSISDHGTVPAGKTPPREIRSRPRLAIVVAVVLGFAAVVPLFLGLLVAAFSCMDACGPAWEQEVPMAIGAVLALSVLAAAVLAVRGHCGRWWVLGLSAPAPATGVLLAGSARLAAVVAVLVAGWLFLVFLSYKEPLRQWWVRIP